MRKKGRGLLRRKKRAAKKCTTPVCPFWVFVVFISVWFAVAFLMLGFFYSAVRWPAQRMIPYVPSEGGTTSLGANVVPDEILDLPSVEREPEDVILSQSASSLFIESCRPLEEGDEDVEMIRAWLSNNDFELRQLGQRCVLNDGSVYVSYTYNASVARSERRYLRYAIAEIDQNGMSPESFYCRTSPRGAPAEMVAENNVVMPKCTFTENGVQIERYPPVGSAINTKDLRDPRNLINMRSDSGDAARDFCVEDSDHGFACLLRNGQWILKPSSSSGIGGELNLYNEQFDLINSTTEDLGYENNSVQSFIGTDGSYIDIYSRGGDGPYQFSKIIRVNIRTLRAETLFESWLPSS